MIIIGLDVECLNFRPGQEISDDDYGPYSEPWGTVGFATGIPQVGDALVLGASRFGLSDVWKIVRVGNRIDCVLARSYQGYGTYE